MNTADTPRETVIHQSANRPNLLLGGDRELVLVMVMMAFLPGGIVGVAARLLARKARP